MGKKPKLLSLEKNILKFRAIQMVMILHEVDYLKTNLVTSISLTDKILNRQLKISPKEKCKGIQSAIFTLVKLGILTADEAKDLKELINFRNLIAHSIHSLLSDITAPSFELGNLCISHPKTGLNRYR